MINCSLWDSNSSTFFSGWGQCESVFPGHTNLDIISICFILLICLALFLFMRSLPKEVP